MGGPFSLKMNAKLNQRPPNTWAKEVPPGLEGLFSAGPLAFLRLLGHGGFCY